MAATTTTSLKVNSLFVDGDTRSFTLKNPKPSITTTEIMELQTFMQANNIIIGDKYGGTFGRIEEVRRITETKESLNFSS